MIVRIINRAERHFGCMGEVTIVFLLSIIMVSAAVAEAEDLHYRLTLASGDTVVGKPSVKSIEHGDSRVASESDPKRIGWAHSAFHEPLLFPIEVIDKIESLSDDNSYQAKGTFRFTLRNGDVIFGDLKDIQNGDWVIDTSLFGEIEISRDMLSAVEPWRDGKSHRFSGPGRLDQWTIKGEAGNWVEDAGALRTEKPISSLFREVGLTRSCRVELELSWEGRPNFIVIIGTDQRGARASNAVRIEVWDSVFTLVRETNEEAEIIPIGTVDSYQGRARWTIQIDQQLGSASLQSIEPKVFAQLELDRQGGIEPGIFFENIEGSCSIESLEITEGASFTESPEDAETRNLVRGGQGISGDPHAIEDGQLVIVERDAPDSIVDRIPVDQLEAIRFRDLSDVESQGGPEAALAESGSTDGNRIMVAMDGTRVTCDVTAIQNDMIEFKTSYSERAWNLPIPSLMTLQSRSKIRAIEPDPAYRYGKLILEDAMLSVALRDSQRESDISCFRLAVLGATNEVRLLNTVSGVISFEKENGVKDSRKRNRSFLGSVVTAISGSASEKRAGRGVHLRNGDSIPGNLLEVDSEGILFDSAITGRIRISHAEIKAVDFNTLENVLQIDNEKRNRLLTIPRLRRKSPPQHLLVSNDGDYLLGTVLKLDDQVVLVSKGLDELEIPRRYLSKLIWFHEDELEGSEVQSQQDMSTDESESAENVQTDVVPGLVPSVIPGADAQTFVVQAIQGDGVRLTFQPEQVGGGELVGSSRLLGTCLIDLKTVDRLILGASVNVEASQLPYHQWRLAHAPLPRVYSEDGDEEMANAGKEHVLVGQDAPELRLKRFDGGDFQLSEYRGKIVVLDFWASWCGPCIRAMPQVDAVVSGFGEEQVQLVAVNLQESVEQIGPALQRMGIDPLVVLDVDGVAAARYEATAIPQTVIVDGEGIVRRVFVGAGGNLQEQLKLAIEQVLSQTSSN